MKKLQCEADEQMNLVKPYCEKYISLYLFFFFFNILKEEQMTPPTHTHTHTHTVYCNFSFRSSR